MSIDKPTIYCIIRNGLKKMKKHRIIMKPLCNFTRKYTSSYYEMCILVNFDEI